MDTRQMSGTYRGKVTDALLGEAGNGNVQVVFTCEMRVDDNTVRLPYYGPFTDKTTEHTFKALRAAGYASQDLTPLAEPGGWQKAVPTPPDVDFAIEQEPDMERNEQGELVHKVDEAGVALTRARVRWVNSTTIGVRNPLTPEKAKMFAAKMNAQLRAFDAKNKTPGQKTNGSAPRHEEPPPPTDSDAPPF